MTDIYLDWAATAPADIELQSEGLQIATTYYGNPSSVHKKGQEARAKLEEARNRCAQALKVKPQQLYFTSGGTESDQFPMLSLLQRPTPGSIVISAIEHPAIINQAEVLSHLGWRIITVRPDHNGIIQPESIIASLQKDTCLVMLQAVNNETGAIQPVEETGRLLEEYGKTNRKPKFHIDAVQALGKTVFFPVDCHADSAAFSAHKIGGMRGSGLLYVKDRMEPFLRGGGQEQGIRPGTENLAAAWTLSRCIEKHVNNAEIRSKARANTATLIRALRVIPGCSIIPESRIDDDPRFSPFVIQVSFAGIPGEVTVRGLSAEGIFISTGSACSSKKKERPVLAAMGITADESKTAVRFSPGFATTEQEINTTVLTVQSFISSFGEQT